MCPHSSSALFTPDRAKPTSCIVCRLCSAPLVNGQRVFCSHSSSCLKFPTPALKAIVQEKFTRWSLQCPMQSSLLFSQWDGKADTRLGDQQISLWRRPGEWLGMQSLQFFLNEITPYILHLAQIKLEENPNNDYRYQLKPEDLSLYRHVKTPSLSTLG